MAHVPIVGCVEFEAQRVDDVQRVDEAQRLDAVGSLAGLATETTLDSAFIATAPG